MKSQKEKIIKIKLILNFYEAKWLKALVQNPIGDLSLEDPRDGEMRRRFWDELNKYDM